VGVCQKQSLCDIMDNSIMVKLHCDKKDMDKDDQNSLMVSSRP